MTNSRHIAGLIGPTLITITISEAMNSHIWATVPATQTYLAGSLCFVAGLSIVRAHNRWMGGWSVMVTLMGWFFILGGLFRMFAPEFAQQSVQNTSAVFVLQMVLLAIGIFLTFKAYSREI
jgi:predicted phage tail protein